MPRLLVLSGPSPTPQQHSNEALPHLVHKGLLGPPAPSCQLLTLSGPGSASPEHQVAFLAPPLTPCPPGGSMGRRESVPLLARVCQSLRWGATGGGVAMLGGVWASGHLLGV